MALTPARKRSIPNPKGQVGVPKGASVDRHRSLKIFFAGLF